MCRRITCTTCGKPGYAGCGNHVEEVLGAVPAAERCACNGTRTKSPRRGWRLFGRR